MTNFDAKYENRKNKLLDLGKRNKLLNYMETKSSTLLITYPDYRALYDSFVKNEMQIRDVHSPYSEGSQIRGRKKSADL